jgi:hypothetical protein
MRALIFVIVIAGVGGPVCAQPGSQGPQSLEACFQSARDTDPICSNPKNDPAQRLECFQNARTALLQCMERASHAASAVPDLPTGTASPEPSKAARPPTERPAKVVDAPAKRADAPAKQMNAPAKQANTPAIPTDAPAAQADAPAKPVAPPEKQAIAPPTKPMDAPAKQESAPVTDAPATPAPPPEKQAVAPPTKPMDAPAKQESAPVTDAPATPAPPPEKQAVAPPTKPMDAPAKQVNAPAMPTDAPANRADAPATPVTPPEKQAVAPPTKPMDAPAKQVNAPAIPTDAPANRAEAAARPAPLPEKQAIAPRANPVDALANQAGGPAKQADWIVSETTSPVDFGPLITAVIHSTSGPNTLAVRCRGLRTELLLRTEQAWRSSPSGEILIAYQINDQAAVRLAWALSPDGKTASYKQDAIDLLQSLPEGARLKISVFDGGGSGHDAAFQLTGLDEIRKKLATVCKRKPSGEISFRKP